MSGEPKPQSKTAKSVEGQPTSEERAPGRTRGSEGLSDRSHLSAARTSVRMPHVEDLSAVDDADEAPVPATVARTRRPSTSRSSESVAHAIEARNSILGWEEAKGALNVPTTTPAAAKGVSKKKALLVGINIYPDPRNYLPSCVADVRAFESLLFGHYQFEEIRRLEDDEATVKAFSDNLDWLFEGATEDSRLVLFYSGHGYQTQTQPGMLEEFLVLYDGLLLDDILTQKSQSAPERVFTVVLDSCFSGGMEKLRFEVTDGTERAKVKVWQPPVEEEARDLQIEDRSFALKPFGSSMLPGRSGIAVGRKSPIIVTDPGEAGHLQLNGILFSACTENETASASNSKTKGRSAFTHVLVETVSALGTELTYNRLLDECDRQLKSLGFRQTPQIKAPKDGSSLLDQAFITLSSSVRSSLPKPENTSQVSEEVVQAMVRRILSEYALEMGGKGAQPKQNQGEVEGEVAKHLVQVISLSLALMESLGRGGIVMPPHHELVV